MSSARTTDSNAPPAPSARSRPSSPPPAEKDAARLLVRNALAALDWGACERMVRINQGERGLADLDWVVPHDVNLILLPKVEDPDQVVQVDVGSKTKHAEIAGVDFEEERGFVPDCAFVVRQVRPVCRADLDQFGSASGHDVRNAEGTPDFDQFTS